MYIEKLRGSKYNNLPNGEHHVVQGFQTYCTTVIKESTSGADASVEAVDLATSHWCKKWEMIDHDRC